VLAEGLAGLSRLTEALSTIDTALARAQRGGELICAPEIFRTKGELLLKDGVIGSAAVAEFCFLQAIDMAAQQGALLWELRAALSLAQLKAQHGQREEARSELSLIYDRFTEGFESGDLRAARSLLCEPVRMLPPSGRGRHKA
jgi:predicted ATPase